MTSIKLAMAALTLLTLAACNSDGRVSVPLDNVGTGAGSAANANNPYSSDPMDPNLNPHYMHSHR